MQTNQMTFQMTMTESKTNYIAGLVSLYYLLIHEDGVIDEKELKMGEMMKKHEQIDEWEFKHYLKKVSNLTRDKVVKSCVDYLKNCDYERKVKCIAWMSMIANSDGFMDPEEWKLIYKIYSTELKLDLTDILEMQKHLPKII